MAHLDLRIRDGCEEPYMEIYVDGVNLAVTLRDAWLAVAGEGVSEEVLPLLGGDYQISETVVGDDAIEHGTEHAILFACGCGHSGCGAVWVRVTVSDATITWSAFRAWLRGREVIAAIEPIVFDKRQFASVLARLREELLAWRPTPRPAPEPEAVRVWVAPPPPSAN